MDHTIEAHGLVKRFGRTTALDGLDLVAERGQVVAVLGPNGAGKTTFVRAVATLLTLDEGSLRVAGHDVRKEPEAVRRAIGLAGQFAAVEPAMTGRENLELVARLFGQSARSARANAAAVLEQLGLSEAADREPRPTPAACAASSTWRPAWWARRGSCCWTSRPPAWTPGAASSCGTPSGP
jgi:ABC-2 type transport system ATP-binding protein